MSAVGLDWTFNPCAFSSLVPEVQSYLRSQAEFAEDKGMLRDDAILHIASKLSGFQFVDDSLALNLTEKALVKRDMTIKCTRSGSTYRFDDKTSKYCKI